MFEGQYIYESELDTLARWKRNREMNDQERLAMEAATPAARELLEAIFAHNEREAEWSKERLAEMEEAERERAIVARGNRIKSRMNQIFIALYGEELGMRYEEQDVDGLKLKRLTICWWDDELEDLINA